MLIKKAQKDGWQYELGDGIHRYADSTEETYCLLYKHPRIEIWGYGEDECKAICAVVLKLIEGRR